MTTLFFPERPDLAVIDRAIARVRAGRTRQTCWALFYESALLSDSCNSNPYVMQYRQHIRGPEGFPRWWNKARAYREERIAALQSFRQACVDAANTSPSQEVSP